MVYKCKICGGSMTVDPKTQIAVCEYCGTKQVLPRFSDDSGRILFERGNHYLSVSEYDKAENIFNQLVASNPNDPEFYWDLVLCKYGVTFVCDPQTGKYIPTCNRTHFSSILNDTNYQKAIELSTPDKASLYKDNAETINNIQKGILALSRKEKPFDIFISYKETDAEGNRSRDSVAAQELYEKLTAEGYKVFFSRITLEDKLGTQYEPYIYAALSSSKVMLTVCSSKEYIESVWVKNEWSRFLTLRQSDPSKELIPLYFDMSESDLPEEFAILSAQNMKKEGFEQELIRGIKKRIPLPVMLAAKRKKQKKTLGITAAVLGGILLVGGLISFPFVKSYINNDKAYQAALKLYENGDYTGAADAFGAISGYKNADEMKENSLNAEEKRIEDEKAANEERIQNEKYEAAMQLYYDGNYPEAAWALRDMNGYKDSAEMQKKAELAWRESLATVAVEINLSASSHGAYYISANGSVETFDYNPGNANDGIRINEHGEIVSIAAGVPLYALYEDGYVANSAINNRLEADWENIIQISAPFNSTSIALTNEGKLVYGNIQNPGNEKDTDSWLEEVSNWTDIISFSYGAERYGYGGLEDAAIVGLKSDGTVVATFYDNNSYSKSAKDFLNSLKNIKKVNIAVGYFVGASGCSIQITAMDTNGILYYFSSDSGISTYENLNCIDFSFGDYIDESHSLLRYDSDKIILEDVVYLSGDFTITRSGTIYKYYTENTMAKTKIKDVWLDRR